MHPLMLSRIEKELVHTNLRKRIPLSYYTQWLWGYIISCRAAAMIRVDNEKAFQWKSLQTRFMSID